MRTACYARFSSDLQRVESLEDQIRSCREYADRNGWTWQETQIFRDAAVSGASIDGRSALTALLSAAAAHPRPFDILLVDDSSRVSRDLADALRIVQRLKFAGVRVIYLSQGIDSDSEQHETLIAVHGLVDGLYLREMAAKVRRGLKGQLARGFATGGKAFGYRSVGIPDPNRHGHMVGYRLNIEPAEAETIRNIFTWYADGLNVTRIIARLTAEQRPGPRAGPWRIGAIQRILRNPKYTGQLVWGRTQQARQPGSRARTTRTVPPEQWQTLARPELRIVEDDLWRRVQDRRRETDALLNPRRQPGRTLLRGRHAALYASSLFGGFMTCGACGRAFTVVGNHLKKGVRYRYYGCGLSSRNGVSACRNRLTVRVEVADQVLLAGLQAELLKPDTVEYISAALASALNAVIDQRPAQRADLLQAREVAQGWLRNLVSAIEAGSTSPTLFAALEAREAELKALDVRLATLEEPIDRPLAVIPTWVKTQLQNAAGLIAGMPERARTEFRRLGIQFVLHPIHDDGATLFLRAVGSGDFEHLAFAKNPVFPASGASPR